ncbi:MAG: hydrolase [Desulfobacterales bacterium]
MLTTDNTVFLMVDVQGKLAHSMHAKENLFKNLKKLVKGMRVLEIPILWAEQNPKGLGPTVAEVAELLTDLQAIPKHSFSCYKNKEIRQALEALKRPNILVAGIESHVCIYQTVRDLAKAKYSVQLVADGISSRTSENKQIGLERCKSAGAAITSVETALFELLEVAEGERFKAILEIVR